MFGKFIKELALINQGMGFLFSLEYLMHCVMNIGVLLKSKSLGSIDATFDVNRIIDVEYKGLNIKISSEMLPTTREIVLKDCYRFDVKRKYQVIVDLGANRGNFSVIAAKCADLVIGVECDQTEMPQKFKDTMHRNSVKNYIFENAFIDVNSSLVDHISVPELMAKHKVDYIDFLKVDIEGAEKAIFREDATWLTKVGAISMEIHPCFGVNMEVVGNVLKKFGFSIQVVDLELKPITLSGKVSMAYIYASRT